MFSSGKIDHIAKMLFIILHIIWYYLKLTDLSSFSNPFILWTQKEKLSKWLILSLTMIRKSPISWHLDQAFEFYINWFFYVVNVTLDLIQQQFLFANRQSVDIDNHSYIYTAIWIWSLKCPAWASVSERFRITKSLNIIIYLLLNSKSYHQMRVSCHWTNHQ